VHLHLVQRIFKNSGILEYLEDSRSIHATLPSGKNIVLSKFASMGSALCFPVEAMVFYTIILCAMHQLDGRRPSSRSIRRYSDKIDIYGDDIIVPVEYTDVVVRYLESYALKVNVNKSFRNSHFRESCGGDYYNGTPVNPVYARMWPADDLRHWGPDHLMSWNATADLFYLRGMWHIAQVIRDLISRVVRRTIPKSRELGSGLAHFSFIFSTNLHWNADLHCWKQKRLHFDPIKRKDEIDGNELACLNKWGLHVERSHRGRGSDDLLAVARLVNRLRRGRSSVPGHISGPQPEDPYVDALIRDSGVCSLPTGLPELRNSDSSIRRLAEVSNIAGSDGVRPVEGSYEWGSYGSIHSKLTLTNLLTGRSEGLSFTHSTKRGSFKSTCRWTSLAG